MVTSVAVACNIGNRAPESLACEEARVLEQTRVGYMPPEPKPPPLMTKFIILILPRALGVPM